MAFLIAFQIQTSDSWIGPDKVKHAAVSYVLYTASSREGKNGWTISISVGLLKEVYDGFFRRGFSYKDLAWDLLGTGLGYLINR